VKHVSPAHGELLGGLSSPGSVRREAADAIDRLLDLLDAIDGDCDLEPSIGGDDREEDHELERVDEY
jgi:hypothetical protein